MIRPRLFSISSLLCTCDADGPLENLTFMFIPHLDTKTLTNDTREGHWKPCKLISASAHHCPDFQCFLKVLLYFYLKTELKKIFLWFFFPVKAEIPYFSDLKLGRPWVDLWRLYFSICERCKSKNFRKIKSFKVKYSFPSPPAVPTTPDLKIMASQFSLEKS